MADGFRQWPGMRTQWAVLPPHEEPTGTGPGQVGVAFSAHSRLPWESAGRARVTDIPPGSAIVTGREGISWLRVGEPTEALEMYPDAELLRAVAGRPVDAVDRPLAVGVPDGVVLAAGSVLRRAHATGESLSDVAASTLAHRLAAHLLTRYARLPVADPGPGPGTLDPHTVDLVAQYVDSGLHATLSLDQLARVALLSPFHFARAFKRSTGMPPHAFVTSRRMDRARHLLRTGTAPVDEVARAVGFSNVSHFRRVFRRHTGLPPSALRG